MDRADAQDRLLSAVQASFEATPNPRLRDILRSLVYHLHRFAAETQLTHEEWRQGLEYLTAVGKACSLDRQEFMLLSDILGLSSAVDVANDHHPLATPGTVLGPYHVSNSPKRAYGASLIDSYDGGQRLRVYGTVRSINTTPIRDALIDVWSCASNGLYPAQDPAQAKSNLRGLLNTDSEGKFAFTVLRPTNYSIPMDGPVGDLMRASSRSPMRAAHVHLIISAPGFKSVTTHLFDSECKYLSSDSVFSTRAELIRTFERTTEGNLSVCFDVTLAPCSADLNGPL